MNINFTVHNNTTINSYLINNLKKISKICEDYLPLEALIVYGAFGRGEGRISINNSGIRIINDIDLLAVIRGKVCDIKDWKEIRNNLQNDSAFYVDIKLLPFDYLSSLPLTMDNYDIKNGSFVFSGDKNILSLIPEYESQNLSMIQGRRLLLNRLITFLEARVDLKKNHLSEKEAAFCNYQSSKVVFACVDAYLILNKNYTTKYLDKVNNFQLTDICSEYNELISRAFKIKVGPDAIPNTNAIEFWLDTGKFYIRTMNEFFNDEIDFKNVLYGKSFLNNIYRIDEIIAKRIIKRIFNRHIYPRQYLETINLLFIYSLLTKDKKRKRIIDIIKKYLNRYKMNYSEEINQFDLTDLYSLVLNLWYKQFHYGIKTYEIWN